MKFILYDNEIRPRESVLISPLDTGILIGDGIFTTLLVSNGIPIFFQEHCKRLYTQAEKFNYRIKEICLESLYQLIIQNDAEKGDYRLKLYYIAQGNFFQKRKLSILLGVLSPYIKQYHFIRLMLYPDPIQTPFSQYKTLGYSHRFFLLQWAMMHQFDDVITKDANDYILETTFANIFWIVNKTFHYPALDLSVFPGISIKIIKRIISSWEGYSVQASYTKIQDIDFSGQWFIINSLVGIIPVIQIGSATIIRNYQLEERLDKAWKKAMEIGQECLR